MNHKLMREAVTAHHAGKHEEADRLYRKLSLQFPRDPDLLHFRGLLASHTGDQAESIRLIGLAIALKPGTPEFHQNLGISHQRAGDDRAAAVAFNEEGNALQARKKLAEARDAFAKALALDPANTWAGSNYGSALIELGEDEQAIEILRKVEKRVTDPREKSLVLSNIGGGWYHLGKMDKAMKYFSEAVSVKPDSAEAHRNLAVGLLAGGKLKEGFEEYEWRCVHGLHFMEAGQRALAQPVWKGETPEQLKGAVLVIQEQGFGDIMQFSRYVPLLAAQGHRVLFEVQPELHTLFSESFADTANIRVIRRQPNGKIAGNLPFAAFVSLMSLPHRLGTTLETVPSGAYLGVAPARLQPWEKLIPRGEGVNVGLVWRGSAQTRHDNLRSMPGEALEPLLARSGVTFYSLQKGEAARHVFAGGNVVGLDARLRDFADTAAALKHLDLVISIDSSVAHLAGAVGCPVWLAMPSVLDWRWMLDREDSPWYPAHRLFRQKKPGDWAGVVAEMGRGLDRLAASRSAA